MPDESAGTPLLVGALHGGGSRQPGSRDAPAALGTGAHGQGVRYGYGAVLFSAVRSLDPDFEGECAEAEQLGA